MMPALDLGDSLWFGVLDWKQRVTRDNLWSSLQPVLTKSLQRAIWNAFSPSLGPITVAGAKRLMLLHTIRERI